MRALTLALLSSSASADTLFARGPLVSALASALTVCQITKGRGR
jgi:hypothetical protein